MWVSNMGIQNMYFLPCTEQVCWFGVIHSVHTYDRKTFLYVLHFSNKIKRKGNWSPRSPPQAHTTGHFATPWPGRRLPANWPKRVQQRPLDSRVPRAAECSTLLLLLVSQKSRLPCRQQIWKLFPENPTILGDKSDRYQKFTAP